jgi:serine/threonine protein kinase
LLSTHSTNHQVAIKQYNIDAQLRLVDQEVEALQWATHNGCRYLMGLEGISLMAHRDFRLMVGLVMPAGNETLWDSHDGARVESEERLRALIFQMLLGVYELHFHNVWHRDLSPGNFMLADRTASVPFAEPDQQLMIIDLGASKLLDKLHTLQRLSVIYTPGFGAPEYVKQASEAAKSSAAPGELRAVAVWGGTEHVVKAAVAAVSFCLE